MNNNHNCKRDIAKWTSIATINEQQYQSANEQQNPH